jgi:hypothetical protein
MRRAGMWLCLLTIGALASGLARYAPSFVGEWQEKEKAPKRSLIAGARTSVTGLTSHDILVFYPDKTWHREELLAGSSEAGSQTGSQAGSLQVKEQGRWWETAPGILDLQWLRQDQRRRIGILTGTRRIRVQWSISSNGKNLTLTEVNAVGTTGQTYEFVRATRPAPVATEKERSRENTSPDTAPPKKP